jgi:hypothetical protein
MNCVSYSRTTGCFNLCNSKDESAQYIFNYGKYADRAKELGLNRGFLVSMEYDNNYSFPDDDPFYLASEIEYIYKEKYLYNGSLKDIQKLVKFLEEIKEENQVELCKDMLDKHNKEIEKWSKKLIEAEEELESCR